MKIKSFESSEISIIPLKDRWYSLSNDVSVKIYTDCGAITIHINKGANHEANPCPISWQTYSRQDR